MLKAVYISSFQIILQNFATISAQCQVEKEKIIDTKKIEVVIAATNITNIYYYVNIL